MGQKIAHSWNEIEGWNTLDISFLGTLATFKYKAKLFTSSTEHRNRFLWCLIYSYCGIRLNLILFLWWSVSPPLCSLDALLKIWPSFLPTSPPRCLPPWLSVDPPATTWRSPFSTSFSTLPKSSVECSTWPGPECRNMLCTVQRENIFWAEILYCLKKGLGK